LVAALAAVSTILVLLYRRYSGKPRRVLRKSPKELTSRSNDTSVKTSEKRSKKSQKDANNLENQRNVDLPDFLMLMGIPGSGKTSWAKQFVFKCDASFTIVCSDDLRKQLTGNINDQSRNEEVWEIVINQVTGLLKSRRNVILDATNVRTDLRRSFIRELPPCNKYIKVFHMNKSVAKCRIAKAIAAGEERSSVPDSVMEKMYASFHESLVAINEEGWMTKT
jgi:predicted kinase